MPGIGRLQRRKALILAENVLYSWKMSKTSHPSRSPVGALFFGSFPRNLNQGRETHAKSRGRKNAPSVEENHRRSPADQEDSSRRPPQGIAYPPCGDAARNR